MDKYFEIALAMARKSFRAGGLPIGSVLVDGDVILGMGHNQRVQCDSPILHAEMDALSNAGRLPHDVYARCTIYTTLTPCYMCAGAIIRAGIPRVVVGEERTISDGAAAWLRSMGVAVTVLDNQEAYDLLAAFREQHASTWAEDKGWAGPHTRPDDRNLG